MIRADVDGINATDLETPNVLGVWVAQDMDDPSRYSVFLLQGGLEMPGRGFYVDTAAAMGRVRGGYSAHVAAMLELAGIADAKTAADAVIASRPVWRRPTCPARSSATSRRATTTGRAPSSPRRRRGSTGRRSSMRPDSARWTGSSCGSRAR